jgi:hypothetical protein
MLRTNTAGHTETEILQPTVIQLPVLLMGSCAVAQKAINVLGMLRYAYSKPKLSP